MPDGCRLVAPGETATVPQWQSSRGFLIVTAALELAANQVTHFYSERKNTEEMIKLIEMLLRRYRHLSCIYLSWDAASWHISKRLTETIDAESLPKTGISAFEAGDFGDILAKVADFWIF